MNGIKCSCHEPGHNYAFNPHPGIKCRKHPHCILKHAEYDSRLKAWKFPGLNHFELGAVVKQNGVLDFKVRCTGCGKTSGSIKKEDFIWLMERGIQFTWFREPYAHADSHVCQVKGCGRTDVEFHHWAPRSIFKEEADRWPVTPLCVSCHKRWHDMTGVATSKPAENLEPYHGKATTNQ